MGQITSDNCSVFSEKTVRRLMDKEEYKLLTPVRYVFLGVDPNGGGSSELAIVSMTMERNNIIICGLESHPCKSHDEIQTLLIQHIRAIRLHPDLKDAWIIFFPENNLGQEASHVSTLQTPLKVLHVRY